MALRVCTEPGCGELVKDGRCDEHRRARDRARGTAAQRGYGQAHRSLRASWQRRMDDGERVLCWRCERPVDPTAWQLGHCDNDRTRYHGPEHVACNLATAGRTRCPHISHVR